WEFKLRDFKLRVSLAQNQISLILHPFKHKVARRSVAKIDEIVSERQPFQRAGRSLFEFDHFRYSAKICHEIHHDHLVFPITQAEPSPKLLDEDSTTMRRAHEYDEIDIGHIDAFVEQVNTGQD